MLNKERIDFRLTELPTDIFERQSYLPDIVTELLSTHPQIDIESRRKDVRLPNSVRVRVRKLKQEGRSEEAILIAQQAKEIKRVRRSTRDDEALHKLTELSSDVVTVTDRVQEASMALGIVTLMCRLQMISNDQREIAVDQIYDNNPGFEDRIQEHYADFRKQIEDVLPPIQR